jgi:hypothetical protein
MTPHVFPPRQRRAPALRALSAPAQEDAFVVCVSPQDARRQLCVSLGLLAVMAAGALAIVASHGLPSANGAQGSAQAGVAMKRAVEQPQFVRATHAARPASKMNGG